MRDDTDLLSAANRKDLMFVRAARPRKLQAATSCTHVALNRNSNRSPRRLGVLDKLIKLARHGTLICAFKAFLRANSNKDAAASVDRVIETKGMLCKP